MILWKLYLESTQFPLPSLRFTHVCLLYVMGTTLRMYFNNYFLSERGESLLSPLQSPSIEQFFTLQDRCQQVILWRPLSSLTNLVTLTFWGLKFNAVNLPLCTELYYSFSNKRNFLLVIWNDWLSNMALLISIIFDLWPCRYCRKLMCAVVEGENWEPFILHTRKLLF